MVQIDKIFKAVEDYKQSLGIIKNGFRINPNSNGKFTPKKKKRKK